MAALTDPGTIGAVFAALYAAHHVAGDWLAQRAPQEPPERASRLAVAVRVAARLVVYLTVLALALVVLALVTGTHFTPLRFYAGMGILAINGYIAARRGTPRPGNVGLLFVAALTIA